MLFYDKQPSQGSLQKLVSFLNQSPDQETEKMKPLGKLPLSREKTLVEELFTFDGPPDATVSIGGDDYYYFSGESYLGLQANPEVLAATCEAVLHYGTSSGSSRRRYTPAPIFEVQRQTAEIYGTEQALYCLNEMDAMEYILETIAESHDAVLVDELCGDSSFAVIRRTLEPYGLKPICFKHRDLDDLRHLLAKQLKNKKKPLIITDGVFNVSGTIAPIPEYYEILSAYPGGALLIDDSDGIGILGEKGRGTLEYFDYETSLLNRTQSDGQGDPTYGIDDWSYADSLPDDFFEEDQEDYSDLDFDDSDSFDNAEAEEENDDEFNLAEGNEWMESELAEDEDEFEEENNNDDFLFLEPENAPKIPPKKLPVRTYLIASLAKGIGGFGAVIPGSLRFLDQIRDSGRFQLSVYPPTPLAAATVKGLQLSFHREEIRHRLWNNVYYFKSELKKLGVEVQENMVPILSLKLGSDQNMRRIQREMIENQILVSFLQKMNSRRPEGTLRIALFASHERAMLDILLENFKKVL